MTGQGDSGGRDLSGDKGGADEALQNFILQLQEEHPTVVFPHVDKFGAAGIRTLASLQAKWKVDKVAVLKVLGISPSNMPAKMFMHHLLMRIDENKGSGLPTPPSRQHRDSAADRRSSAARAPQPAFKFGIKDLYKSQDINGDWWPVTIVAMNPDGTYRAQVHDGHSRTRCWERVLPEHIRDASAVKDIEGHAGYNSRQMTGFIGIRNQGATCYLNSLLQCLFYLSYFRTGIYKMDTREDQDPTQCIPLALQRLFYNLEYRSDPTSTKELTQSFGWGSRHAAVQHDIQELLRVLSDTLRNKMLQQGMQHNAIDKLFLGETTYFVRCTDGVDYTSTRNERFYDLTLVVRGNKDIYAAFEQYCEKDILDGENKYQVEHEDGTKSKHTAERGCIFKRLPPVLILHLRRFDFDPQLMRETKVNDEFVFPGEIDLGKFVDPCADGAPRRPTSPVSAAASPSHGEAGDFPAADPDVTSIGSAGTLRPLVEDDHRYVLHSVMVHGGGVYGGHYTCYVRPNGGDQWYEFDDETVSLSDLETSVKGNYGGRHTDTWGVPRDRLSSAYLLIYIRKQVCHKIVYPPREQEKPTHLRERFERDARLLELEREQRRQRKKCLTVCLVFDDDLCKQCSPSAGLWSTERLPEPQRLLLQRQETSVGALRQFAAGVCKTDPGRVQLWKCTSHATLLRDDDMSLERAFDQYSPTSEEFSVYVEVLTGEDRPEGQGLLFLKRFDMHSDPALVYLGSCPFERQGKGKEKGLDVVELISTLNRKLGREPAAPLAVWVEDSRQLLSPLVPPTDELFGIRSGSVAVCQLADTAEHAMRLMHSEVGEMPGEEISALGYYFQSALRVEVEFRGKSEASSGGSPFRLQLMKSMGYEEVQRAVGAALKLTSDQSACLRFTRNNPMWDRPDSQPLRLANRCTLGWMIARQVQERCFPILWWEVLQLPLVEFEKRLSLRVALLDEHARPLGTHGLLLPPPDVCTVADVVRAAREGHTEQGSFAAKEFEELCLVETRNYVIVHVYRCDAKAAVRRPRNWVHSNWRIEPYPPPLCGEDGELLAGQQLVHCLHYDQDVDVYGQPIVHPHSEPFLLRILETDTADDILKRVAVKLALCGDDGEAPRQPLKWAVRCFYAGQIELLEASELAPPVWQQMGAVARMHGGTKVPSLAFEHRRAPRRSRQIGVKICEGGRDR
eukprot:TRINITY_DN1585_c0_g1_i1.p1 TRINITY_DN1585_c0_g1~~TRINITY_DN1585_c0_g1_i1.p1  ORF type:complete len:1185 (+),score=312.19 TRINITY_DN1585_c0_g1_i1:66-3620(+)